MKKVGIDTYQFECHTCFCCWEEEAFPDRIPDHIECSYCRGHGKYSSLELLKRRFEVMSISKPSRFPELMEHLAKHLVFKE